jgi:hypothetical protein
MGQTAFSQCSIIWKKAMTDLIKVSIPIFHFLSNLLSFALTLHHLFHFALV